MEIRMRHILITALLSFVIIPVSSQINKNLMGEWTFDAPEAPEGATFGTATFKADTITMIFEGGLQFPSDWVKVNNDSITYVTTFDEVQVKFALKIIDEQSLSGVAVSPDGQTPVTFRRKKI